VVTWEAHNTVIPGRLVRAGPGIHNHDASSKSVWRSASFCIVSGYGFLYLLHVTVEWRERKQLVGFLV
jgi:hypothetical protein